MTISPDALSVTVAVPSCIRLSRLSSRAPCPWGEVRTSRWRTRGGLGLGAGCADVCGWGGAAQLDSRTIAPTSSRRFMAARIVDEVGALELLESSLTWAVSTRLPTSAIAGQGARRAADGARPASGSPRRPAGTGPPALAGGLTALKSFDTTRRSVVSVSRPTGGGHRSLIRRSDAPKPTGARRSRVEMQAPLLMTRAKAIDRISGHRRGTWHVGQGPTIRPPEAKRAIRPALDSIALFVHRAVMPSTEQSEVGKRGWPALRPVADVMTFGETYAAARKATASVAMVERAPQRRRNRSRPSTDFDQPPVFVMPHHHPCRIARQAAGRFRGNVRAVLEHGLPRLIRVGQDRSINMNDHLVTLSRGAGIEPMVECRLREQRQRICLLLGHGRGIRHGVSQRRSLLATRSLVQRLARRGQRLHEQRSHFRLQPSANDYHAVVVLIHVKGTADVTLLGLPRLGQPVHLSPAPHDPLDVGGRTLAPNRQQSFFGLRCGHAGQRAGFRVRQFPPRESLGQERQRPERACDTDPLAGRTEIESHSPAQPRRAGAKAGVPSGPCVKLADQGEKVRSRGIEVRGKLGDLVAKPIEINGIVLSDNGSRRLDVHGESPPFVGATLHPDFRGPSDRRERVSWGGK